MQVEIIFPLVAAIAGIGITLVAYFSKQRTAETKAFIVLSLLITLWSLANAFFYIISPGETLRIIAKVVYATGHAISIAFFYFTFVLYRGSARSGNLFVFLAVVGAGLFLLYFFSDAIVQSYALTETGRGFEYGPWRFLFDITFILFFGSGFVELFKALRNVETDRRNQLRYIALGSVAGVLFAGITSIGLLWFNNFSLVWLGPFLVTVWPFSVAYGIWKHQLFNIKVIVTEFLVFLLWMLILVQVFLSRAVIEGIVNATLFAAVVILGLVLIQSVIKEIESREKIEKLAADLQMANEKLKELDQRKSEFVSLASHQLRSPLTAIKGYASMLLEGSFGPLADKTKEAIDRIFESSNRLVNIIEDFLTISRIEQNRLAFSFGPVDFKKLVAGIAEDIKTVAGKRGLTLVFSPPKEDSFMITADSGKIAQVVTNLIDNAIKYTPSGTIEVALKKNEKKRTVLLSVKDSGVGIPKEELQEVFSKFVRGKNAHNINVTGSGLGLYIAQELVKAHNGRIWAESEGEGRGSTFFIELPLV